MVAIIQAERIFHITGHAVWPWEVEKSLPDDWLDAFRAYSVEVGDKARKRREIEKSAPKRRKGRTR